jgi:hypothetical protein
MFRTRKAQHDAIAMKLFIDRMEGHILERWFARKVFAEERAGLPLRAVIQHGIGVAQGYGLETERDLMLFVLNMINVNPEFHRQPHVHAILEEASVTGPEWRERLLTDVSDAEWEQAAVMTNADDYWTRVLPADG